SAPSGSSPPAPVPPGPSAPPAPSRRPVAPPPRFPAPRRGSAAPRHRPPPAAAARGGEERGERTIARDQPRRGLHRHGLQARQDHAAMPEGGVVQGVDRFLRAPHPLPTDQYAPLPHRQPRLPVLH